MDFEMLGHMRGQVDDPTHGIAGVDRAERAIGHVHLIDLGRCDKAPARREGIGIAEQIGDQHTIGVKQRLGAGDGAGGARGNDAVAIANIALTHLDAGQIFDRLGSRHGVDTGADVIGGHAFDHGRHLGHGSLLLADDDDAGAIGRGGGICVDVRSESGRCDRECGSEGDQ